MICFELVVFMFLLVYFGDIKSVRHCKSHERYLNYYKLRVCYKSTLPVIAWIRSSTIDDCMEFARKKDGLAFNFSPNEAADYRNFSRNCQVLGCPETENSLTLVADVAFDYYSAYGNWNMTENSTCINSVGLFGLTEEKQNYTVSSEKCQEFGGHLANVLSEVRTNHLSKYVNDTLQDWYKVAYVGLNDIRQESVFITAQGSMLSCFRYRAWAPGHPTSKRKDEDCVVLDTDRMWRVVRCGRKFSALCEFLPAEPKENVDFRNITCDKISNEDKRLACEGKEKGFDLCNNCTRLNTCSIVHAIYGNNSSK